MKSFELNVKVDATENNLKIIELSGFLDAHTVNSFEFRLDETMQDGQRNVVIDLHGLNYISSAGIGALMALTQKLRNESGDLVLLRPNEKVFKILDLLGFTKIFNIAVKEEDISGFFK
jgi:anti-sigma B factor antagonist